MATFGLVESPVLLLRLFAIVKVAPLSELLANIIWPLPESVVSSHTRYTLFPDTANLGLRESPAVRLTFLTVVKFFPSNELIRSISLLPPVVSSHATNISLPETATFGLIESPVLLLRIVVIGGGGVGEVAPKVVSFKPPAPNGSVSPAPPRPASPVADGSIPPPSPRSPPPPAANGSVPLTPPAANGSVPAKSPVTLASGKVPLSSGPPGKVPSVNVPLANVSLAKGKVALVTSLPFAGMDDTGMIEELLTILELAGNPVGAIIELLSTPPEVVAGFEVGGGPKIGSCA